MKTNQFSDGLGGDMLFNSYSFILFLAIVLALYYVLPTKIRCTYLLIASYFFYMSWDVRYALLMLLSTGLTYISGIMLYGEDYMRFIRLYEE